VTTTETNRYLRPTPILDFGHPDLQHLIAQRGWTSMPERERIGAIYTFVRDEIGFGYNVSDDLPASRVLADGIGQCKGAAHWWSERFGRQISDGQHVCPAVFMGLDLIAKAKVKQLSRPLSPSRYARAVLPRPR
jgi:hypothetical protein